MLPHRVLIVASDDFQLSLMSDLLEANDVRTHRARTADEALQLALGVSPTMVLIDLDLDGGETRRVLEGLRGDEATRETPVMAVAGARQEQMASRVLDRCYSGRVDKPIDTGAFPRQVMRQIRRHTTSAGRAAIDP